MEANENPLSPYFHLQQQQHHHHHHQSPTTAATTATIFPSSTNGLLPSALHMSSPATTTTSDTGPHMLYPHSAPSAAVSPSPLESVRRKRGRPRKYGTPEEALAAKKAATASAHSSSSKKNRGSSFSPSASSISEFSKKSQLGALGNAGQGFTPHVLSVAAGEDVGQKIMLFMQQSKKEMCVLSASGSISNAALWQPATSGGNIAYEGRFEIISLSGSYVRTELGGRTGGLSVCLSSTDGQIVGGGVGGPLKALGPVQVIVGTFQMDPKKEAIGGPKSDAAASKLQPIGGLSGSNSGYRSTIESSGRNPARGNNDHQPMGGTHFILQPHAAHISPQMSDWRSSSDHTATVGYELEESDAGQINLEKTETTMRFQTRKWGS